MDTLILNKLHFDKDNVYIGKIDVSNYNGNIEIQPSLGMVFFNRLKASGYIVTKTGTGIKSGYEITSGKDIKSDLGIKAVKSIKADLGIESGEISYLDQISPLD